MRSMRSSMQQGAFLALPLLLKPHPTAASKGKLLGLYEPRTNVNDIAAIDLDQRTITARLALGSQSGFEAAFDVYSMGAFSAPYAMLTLATPITISAGTTVTGTNTNNEQVVGTTIADTKRTKAGENILLVQYAFEAFQGASATQRCRVGGSPNPDVTECFAPSGKISVDGADYSYSYSPLRDNLNGETIQRLSTQAREEMYEECEQCAYPTYKRFLDFYGDFDYADEWIKAAFSGTSTGFPNGNADFSNFDLEGRAAAIRWGTVVLNIWMHAVSNLEEAVSICQTPPNDNNRPWEEAWDEAVALYTGSVPKTAGDDSGYLFYTLAQTECKSFGTCNRDGMADVNSKVFDNFEKGKRHLGRGKCRAAEVIVKRIVELMTVPLVQGVLRSAHALDIHDDHQGMIQGQAAAFAASLLPILNSCSEPNAFIIHDDLAPGKGPKGSYEVIRAALERSYGCLGITCEDVGGLLDPSGDGYLLSAEPCTKVHSPNSPGQQASPTRNSNPGLAIGLSFGILATIAAVIVGIHVRKGQKEFDTAEDDAAAGTPEVSEPGSEVPPVV